MIRRNLVLSSAIAVLVSAGFAAHSTSVFAEEPGASPENSAAKHGEKKAKKGKHCDCKKKNCTEKHCHSKDGADGKKAKDSCESKNSCESKDGCHAADKSAPQAAPEADKAKPAHVEE